MARNAAAHQIIFARCVIAAVKAFRFPIVRSPRKVAPDQFPLSSKVNLSLEAAAGAGKDSMAGRVVASRAEQMPEVL
jgi:hypothetical protein